MPTGANGVIYARFFLHAIQEEEENAFWQFCQDISNWRHIHVAVEFRSSRDKLLTKTTPDHFRRYISPSDLIVRAAKWGFKASYFVEGFGLAKYRLDDAHVARVLFAKNSEAN